MIESILQSAFEAVYEVFSLIINPKARMFWLYGLTSVLIAIAALHWNAARGREDGARGLRASLRAIFDPKVWGHRSAVIDYLCYGINTVLGTLTRIFALASGASLGALLYAGLIAFNDGAALGLPATWWTLGVYTAVALVLLDLGRFVTHAMMHQIPVLWELHKVHHSAQVLTPMTSFRLHPLEVLLIRFVVGLFIGAASGVGLFLFGEKVEPLEILGLNVGVFAFNILGANLRHSQIWLPYPRWLSHILVSPAQHQVHHSIHPKHHDRNYGVMFAFWDWIYGTLYVPARDERIVYGLENGEDGEYQTVANLYVLPLRKAWGLLARMPRQAGR